jgi:hypothetical protein
MLSWWSKTDAFDHDHPLLPDKRSPATGADKDKKLLFQSGRIAKA